MKTIAFDVDNTLIEMASTGRDVPKYSNIQFLKRFAELGWKVYVWSGSGTDWAETWIEKLGLHNWVVGAIPKGSIRPDIAVDDEDVELGIVNIKV